MTDNAQTKDLAWQLEELEKLVHDRFVQKNDNVKGAFTSGDFVEWRLRNIFGPQNISVELRDGPRVVTISESQAYTQALIRMEDLHDPATALQEFQQFLIDHPRSMYLEQARRKARILTNRVS